MTTKTEVATSVFHAEAFCPHSINVGLIVKVRVLFPSHIIVLESHRIFPLSQKVWAVLKMPGGTFVVGGSSWETVI